MGLGPARTLRSMRNLKSGLDVAKGQKARTTNSLGNEDVPAQPEASFDRGLAQILTKEQRRAAAFEASVEKSRQRLLKVKDKLATVIRRNQTLMDLRHDIQAARSEKGKPPSVPAQKQESEFREVEFKY